MRKYILALFIMSLIVGVASAATLQKGKTFTSTETVTNTKLHSLVDDGTISDIDQDDIKANYGLVEKSSSTAGDTDSLWNDSTNNCIKGYVGGAWEEIGTTPSSIVCAGTAAFSGNVSCDGVIYNVVNYDGTKVYDKTPATMDTWTELTLSDYIGVGRRAMVWINQKSDDNDQTVYVRYRAHNGTVTDDAIATDNTDSNNIWVLTDTSGSIDFDQYQAQPNDTATAMELSIITFILED